MSRGKVGERCLLHPPAKPRLVPGIAADLERVVANLAGNAIKFTNDGGWVRWVLST